MTVSLKLVGRQYIWLNSLVGAAPAGGGESAGKRRLAHIGKRLPADAPKWRRGEIETSSIRRAKSPADRLP
ncbi:MAG: hypothetical protein EKK51_17550 [Mycolicibacterium sp.]|uniref:hypothetical protein n=1 Tax=Mycolicibacterium sp. TaxID=2320850 RepID=UPI000FBB3D5A|nr:hypothetical protein [Mycolicibacterium sp.]RUP30216.1 MAG: hypothetical protein EKK51_17550 [Mycolicibacterium sp.]